MTLAICIVASSAFAFAIGYAIGQNVGYTDGVADRDEYTRKIRFRPGLYEYADHVFFASKKKSNGGTK